MPIARKPANPRHQRAKPGPWLWEDHPVRLVTMGLPAPRPRLLPVHPRWHDAAYWQQQAAAAARTCPVCDGDGAITYRPWKAKLARETVCLACGGSGQRAGAD